MNMRKRLSVALLGLLLACTDETASRKTLESSGFTDIRLTGYEFLVCSQDETFHTGFTATNAQGKTVQGVVCCGWFKSCTVRF